MNAIYQHLLVFFEGNAAYIDAVFAMIHSCFPRMAQKLEADRAGLKELVDKFRAVVQENSNPILVPFQVVAFFFLLRTFSTRCQRFLKEFSRNLEEEIRSIPSWTTFFIRPSMLSAMEALAGDEISDITPPWDPTFINSFSASQATSDPQFCFEEIGYSSLFRVPPTGGSSSSVPWRLGGETTLSSLFDSAFIMNNSSFFSPSDSRLRTPDFFHSAFIIHNSSFLSSRPP